MLKALNETGKAGIILPHGVLFRGNAEETIRKEILKRKYIKGIVGLPANLFYGTGIPACIIIIDKEDADKREGLFMIDASEGYKKDGNKNRLREQDIEKIVQVFTHKTEIQGYSRFITYREIEEEHDGNLNIPRYITKIDKKLAQNINSHLNGGIPELDINSMNKLWNISSDLKNKIFEKRPNTNVYDLKVEAGDIENLILDDVKISDEINKETIKIFNSWKASVKDKLKNIDETIEPKTFIRKLGLSILKIYEDAKLLDNYEVYDFLLNYWNEKLQDDVYIIKASGYKAGHEIERKVDNKDKLKSFDGLLIPRTVIENEYFKKELKEIEKINYEISQLEDKLNEIFEENSGEDGLLVEALNDNADGITKTSLNNRLNELDSKKVSKDVDDLTNMIEAFDNQEKMEAIFSASLNLSKFDLRKKNGKFGKGKINSCLKEAQDKAKVPENYKEEYDLLIDYKNLFDKKDEHNKVLKDKIKELDEMVEAKYSKLSIDEIKDLLFEKKWMARLNKDIKNAANQKINEIASKLVDISKRYEHTLSELEAETETSRAEVKKALERIGYRW